MDPEKACFAVALFRRHRSYLIGTAAVRQPLPREGPSIPTCLQPWRDGTPGSTSASDRHPQIALQTDSLRQQGQPRHILCVAYATRSGAFRPTAKASAYIARSEKVDSVSMLDHEAATWPLPDQQG